MSNPENSAGNVIISLGLPEHLHDRAAEILYAGFGSKIHPLVGSREVAIALFAKNLNPDMAMVALYREQAEQEQTQLAGLAGLQFDERKFLNFTISSFVQEIGWLRGLLTFLLMRLFANEVQPQEICIDLLAVDANLRGRGFGSALINAVCDFAQTNNFDTVSLNVVDTNPDARRLYERMGFIPVKTSNYGFLSRFLGSSAVTKLSKNLPPQLP